MSVFPPPGRWRQEYHEIKTGLDYEILLKMKIKEAGRENVGRKRKLQLNGSEETNRC